MERLEPALIGDAAQAIDILHLATRRFRQDAGDLAEQVGKAQRRELADGGVGQRGDGIGDVELALRGRGAGDDDVGRLLGRVLLLGRIGGRDIGRLFRLGLLGKGRAAKRGGQEQADKSGTNVRRTVFGGLAGCRHDKSPELMRVALGSLHDNKG